jgi:hypothetical protein
MMLLSETIASMRRRQVLVRADRDDTGRIDVVVCDVVVPLDMIEIHGLGDTVGLVEIPEIPEEIRVIDDSPDVALKMAVVDHIEPNQRDKEAPVGFHEFRSE